MSVRGLNGKFFALQGMLALMESIGIPYLSTILLRFGCSAGRIGLVMTLAALASMLARPVWGYLNDRLSCAKQVVLASMCVGVGCFFLLTGSGGRLFMVVPAVMGLYMTLVCMMNFADSWALRLLHGGCVLNYGATRAGGSIAYALGAAVFGTVAARFGFTSGGWTLLLLLVPLTFVVRAIPNPQETAAQEKAVSVLKGLRSLIHNRPYLWMLLAYFLCTLCSSAIDSFYSVQLVMLGGTEREVGITLFLQALCEVPMLAAYSRIRRRISLSSAWLMAISMVFYGCRSLALGLAVSCGGVMATALFQMLSFALFTPACVDFMLETVDSRCLATAHLVFLSVGQGAGSMAGNALGGVLADCFGMNRMFCLLSVLAFAGFFVAAAGAALQQKQSAL